VIALGGLGCAATTEQRLVFALVAGTSEHGETLLLGEGSLRVEHGMRSRSDDLGENSEREESTERDGDLGHVHAPWDVNELATVPPVAVNVAV